jgi:ABC-type amino acid transport substrate-binding protein
MRFKTLLLLTLQTIIGAGSAKVLFCGTDIRPFVMCKDGVFGGYEKSIIQSIESAGGFLDGIDYEFKCFESFGEAFNSTRNCTCDGLIGHITPTVKRKVSDGIQFSQPHLATSVATVIRRGKKKNMFDFLKPFETTLWLTIVCIPIIYATIFAGTNFINRFLNGKFILSPPGGSVFVFISEFFHTIFGGGALREFKSDDILDKTIFNVNVLMFSFFFLFMTSVYTANLANLIISSSVSLNIDDIEVLSTRSDLRILTNTIYTEFLLNQYNIEAEPWTWLTNSSSYIDAVERVASGEYDALISDRGTLLWVIRERNKCDVTLLPGSDLTYFSVSTGFSPCFDAKKIDEYNTHLFQARDRGDLDRIGRTALGPLYYKSVGIASYDTYLNPACAESEQIGLDDISGLLIVIAVPLGIVAILPFAVHLVKKMRKIQIPQ